MTSTKPILPDFMVIGAMKCATSTLHEQLALQDGVFMSNPKEPNFFSDDENFNAGLQSYSDLFKDGGEKLKGESSTHYTKFPTYPNTIARMKQSGVSACRFIYVIRHPIDRLISHYMHEWSQGIISCDIDSAVKKHPELIQYSQYDYQLLHYIQNFPNNPILLVFYEHLINDPDTAFSQICAFLDLPPESKWNHSMEAQNQSAKRIRKFPLYNLIIETTAMTWLRRNLIPKEIRNRVKNNLSMTQRPIISPAIQAELVKVFNDDLQHLSSRLDLQLSIENYKEVATQQHPIKVNLNP